MSICRLNIKTNRCSKQGTGDSNVCILQDNNRCALLRNTKKNKKIRPKKKTNSQNTPEIKRPKRKTTKSKKTPKKKTKSKTPITKISKKKILKIPTKGNRTTLCHLPSNYEYVSRLGNIGKDGETWRVKDNKTGILYACKIFTAKKSLNKIKLEIDTQEKLKGLGVAPDIIWRDERCFIMELINGKQLLYFGLRNLTNRHFKQIENICYKLAQAGILYDDGNMKMNLIHDNENDKFILIDYGMIRNIKKSPIKSLSLKDYMYVMNLNIFVNNIEFLLSGSSKERKYTPFYGGYIPTDPKYNSFLPEIAKFIDPSYINILFKQNKIMRERMEKNDLYVKAKMEGMRN